MAVARATDFELYNSSIVISQIQHLFFFYTVNRIEQLNNELTHYETPYACCGELQIQAILS